MINLAVVAEIAAALKELNDQVVFVGGAVVSLYTDDPAADEIRPTKDVDLTIQVSGLSHWSDLQERLSTLGFHSDPFGQAICSYKYKDIPVDIMSTKDGPLGPTNRWYKVGFEDLQMVEVNDRVVRIFSAPCYLATKFEAFNNRGRDYRYSHDVEDIIYIIDNRLNIVSEVLRSDPSILSFVREQLQIIIKLRLLDEVLLAHVHPLMQEERIPIVKGKISQIIGDYSKGI